MDMSKLNRDLPGPDSISGNVLDLEESDLHKAFKSAALNVTNLYRTGLNLQNSFHRTGYIQALSDVVKLIDSGADIQAVGRFCIKKLKVKERHGSSSDDEFNDQLSLQSTAEVNIHSESENTFKDFRDEKLPKGTRVSSQFLNRRTPKKSRSTFSILSLDPASNRKVPYPKDNGSSSEDEAFSNIAHISKRRMSIESLTLNNKKTRHEI